MNRSDEQDYREFVVARLESLRRTAYLLGRELASRLAVVRPRGRMVPAEQIAEASAATDIQMADTPEPEVAIEAAPLAEFAIAEVAFEDVAVPEADLTAPAPEPAVPESLGPSEATPQVVTLEPPVPDAAPLDAFRRRAWNR